VDNARRPAFSATESREPLPALCRYKPAIGSFKSRRRPNPTTTELPMPPSRWESSPRIHRKQSILLSQIQPTCRPQQDHCHHNNNHGDYSEMNQAPIQDGHPGFDHSPRIPARRSSLSWDTSVSLLGDTRKSIAGEELEPIMQATVQKDTLHLQPKVETEENTSALIYASRSRLQTFLGI